MKILILSRNPALYSTNSLAVAARKRGHQVRVIDHINCDAIVDNRKNVILYHGEEIRHFDALIPRIGSSVTKYGAMIVRQFETMGIWSTLSADALIRTRDKLTCLQILSNAYLPVPQTAMTNNYYSLGNMLKYIGKMPIIIKLIEGTHGMGVIKADNFKIAESIMEAFYKSKHKVLLQEYISEASGEDVRAFVVGDKIVAAMKRKAKPGEFRSNLHRGATSVKIELTEEEKNVAVKAVKTMGLHVAGVDILRSSRGPLIMEVNASPGLEGIENTTKIDIAGEIIEYVVSMVKK